MQSGSKYQAEPMEMESESHEKDLTDNLVLKPKTTEEAQNRKWTVLKLYIRSTSNLFGFKLQTPNEKSFWFQASLSPPG